jgi:hypothetical protein
MKSSEIQKFLARTFSERLAQLGYARDRKFDSYFVKRYSSELVIGILPVFEKWHGKLRVKFRFGVYSDPIEQELNSLCARTTFLDAFCLETIKFTFTDVNTNFPPDYASYLRKSENHPGKMVGVSSENDTFDSELRDDQILARANYNLKIIEEHSLKFFETLNKQTILEELKRNHDDSKKLIAFYIENDFEKVETLVANCLTKNPLKAANSAFYEKLLQASAEKKKSGINDGADKRLNLDAQAERARELLKAILVERFSKWGYQLDTVPFQSMLSDWQGLYVKNRTEDIVSGIYVEFQKRVHPRNHRYMWFIQIVFVTAFEPIEQLIDFWHGGRFRSDFTGWGRWTVRERIWNELPEEYRLVSRFSEDYNCVVYDNVEHLEIPIDLSEQTVRERINVMLDMIEEHCIPLLEQTVEINGMISKLHSLGESGVRLYIAYYLAGEFDKAQKLVKEYLAHHKECDNEPIWCNLLQACTERKPYEISQKER